MRRPPMELLDRQCQKPGHPRLGTWLARRVGRPAALRITWLVLPWGVSAHGMTLAAWALGALGAAALAWGTPAAWMLALALLWGWYLADHVDGQLARWQGEPSLDGAQLDYWMHHTLAWAVPLGLGLGLARASAQPLWTGVGIVWGAAALVVSLEHDTRWKTFEQRLKRLQGRLEVVGGGGGRPDPAPPRPRSLPALARWSARKFVEPHAVLLVLSLLAPLSLVASDPTLLAPRCWAGLGVVASVAVALGAIHRSLTAEPSERAFQAWFRVPAGSTLVYRDGWWQVVESAAASDALAEEGAARSGRGSS